MILNHLRTFQIFSSSKLSFTNERPDFLSLRMEILINFDKLKINFSIRNILNTNSNYIK